MSSYSRKTYVGVAHVLALEEDSEARHRSIARFAELFSKDNPRFDREVFHDQIESLMNKPRSELIKKVFRQPKRGDT